MGIAPADLAVRHPNVIPVEIDGYGPGGPISHKRAYDLLVQAESGSCAVTGYPGMPAKPGPADGRLHHGAVCGDLHPGAAVRAESTSSCKRGAVRRTEPVRRDDRRHGLRADVHPALRHRPAAARRRARPPSRRTARSPPATARPSCSAPPTTASGSGWPGRSSTVPTWPTMRASPPTPAAAHTARCSTRRSDHGVPSTSSPRSRRSPTPLASATRATTCPARWWSTRSSPPVTGGGPSARRPGDIQALRPPPVISGFEQPMGAVPGLGQHTDAVLGELGLHRQRKSPSCAPTE